ncbi:MAG: isoprenylcysteine carboxylmethyltransferase family protein [Pseudomonadota bacterium]
MSRPIVPPPVIGIAFGAAMLFVQRGLPQFQLDVPGGRIAAIIVAVIGLSIEVAAVGHFFRRKTTINPLAPDKTQHLVVEGLYRVTRNPMYLGMAILLTGWALWLGNPINIAFVALFVVVLTELQIKPEERALEAKFGESYRDYCQRVRRWV